MCCCRTDRCTKRLVGIFGFLTAVSGVVAFGLSINMVARTGWLREKDSDGFLYSIQVWMTTVFFCTAFVVFIMGGLAICANYVHRCFCTFCYGFWLVIVLIILTIVILPIITVYYM